MSYYTLDNNNQIYGNYVKRLGDILREYKGENEVTLAISTLQSLLTVLTESKLYKNKKNVIESLYYAEEIQELKAIGNIVSNKTIMGINKSSIIENTYCNSLNIKDVLSYIRHALSHPVSGVNQSSIPRTGFYTIQNETIKKIIFVNSPDLKAIRYNQNSFEKYKINDGFPKNAKLIEKKLGRRTIKEVIVDGDTFYRFIKIEFTPKQLKQLALDLSYMFSEFIMHAESPEDTIRMLSAKFAA